MTNDKSFHKQSGTVFVVVLLFLVLSTSTYFLRKLNTGASRRHLAQQSTAAALAEAKAVLIGYALTYAEQYQGQPQGFLPCPDTDGDGGPGPKCGKKGESVIGWLPWRQLGIPPLRDGSGTCLWYAVSGRYKNKPKSSLTSDTDGQFIIKDIQGDEVIGSSVASSQNAIAIVFSAGAPFGNQTRSTDPTECGDPADINHYLDTVTTIANTVISNARGTESSTVDGQPGSKALPTPGISVFVSAPKALDAGGEISMNDTLLAITPGDFMLVYERMDRWVAERVRGCLETYGSETGRRYPWAAPSQQTTGSILYQDVVEQRFGRIPWGLSQTTTTNPAMDDLWGLDPADPGDSHVCFDESGGNVAWSWWWWDEWKEMVFYAVDQNYAPDGSSLTVPTLNVQVDGTTLNSEFLILVAGRKLGATSRESAGDRGSIGNFLEDQNILADADGNPTNTIPGGDETFVSGAITPIFNDIVCTNSSCL